jgi:hypothetical protein
MYCALYLSRSVLYRYRRAAALNRVGDGDVMTKRRVSHHHFGFPGEFQIVHFRVCISLDFSCDGSERAETVYREHRSLLQARWGRCLQAAFTCAFQCKRSREEQSSFVFWRPQVRFSIHGPASLSEYFRACCSRSRQFALCEENPS